MIPYVACVEGNEPKTNPTETMKKSEKQLREKVEYLLVRVHPGPSPADTEFQGGTLKGLNVQQWCRTADFADIKDMAESYSLFDY